jgi:membrane protease subunit HflK
VTFRLAVRIVVILALAAWVLSSVYVIRPSELAVVLRFGAPLPDLLRPGLHLCPRGVERVLRVEATRAFTLSVGFEDRGGTEAPREDALWLTGDTNILTVRIAIQYQISDPAQYLLRTQDPPEVLRRATETALTQVVAATGVDDILTTGRAVFVERVRRRAQEVLDGYGAGVHLVSLALRSAEPPSTVIAAFQDVQNARSDREKVINEARGYANETVPRARGDAETMTAAAAAERGRRVEAAKGDAGRFEAVRAAAGSAEAFRQRVYLETLERVMPRVRVYVVEGGSGGTRLRLVQRAPARPAAAGGRPP